MKYLGSKDKISDDILKVILGKLSPEDKRTFVDAFCGGCNVSKKVKDRPVIANDSNKYLMAMLNSLKGGKEFPEHIDKDYYDDVRTSFNKKDSKYDDDEKGWVGFMGSRNGRFFDGGYSGHNVKGRDYIGQAIKNVKGQIGDMSNIDMRSGDYQDIDMPDDSIIYCDIPYKNSKGYTTSKNFDYENFYNWCKAMKDKGHDVYVSEYDMPDDRFKEVWRKDVTNSMHPTKTKKPVEKLYMPRE